MQQIRGFFNSEELSRIKSSQLPPSCPGRGGVNSTQLFGPMNIEQFKNLTSENRFSLERRQLKTSLPFEGYKKIFFNLLAVLR